MRTEGRRRAGAASPANAAALCLAALILAAPSAFGQAPSAPKPAAATQAQPAAPKPPSSAAPAAQPAAPKPSTLQPAEAYQKALQA